MYVARKYKFICSFILIILLIFCSISGTILNSNAHASVIATGMTVKALWIAISAIAAGVVFTSPNAVEGFVDDAIGHLEGTHGGVIYNDKEWIEFQGQLKDKFDDAKKKLPKPPDPNKMKNNLLWLGGSAAVLIDKLVDLLNGNDDLDDKHYNKETTITLPNGDKYILKSGNFLNTNGYLISGVYLVRPDGTIKGIHSASTPDLKYEYELKNLEGHLYIRTRYQKGDGNWWDWTNWASLHLNIGTTTIPKPVIPGHNPKPKPLPPGVVIPNGTPTKSEPGKAPILPMPFPTTPNVPNPDWSDFGFDVTVVPGVNPNPNPNPDPGTNPDPNPNPDPGTNPDPSPSPNPNPGPIQVPNSYPNIGPGQVMDLNSGVKPSDLVGLNQTTLNQWLQDNTYNITNNTYNGSDFDVDDPDFDDIDFDFSPLTNVGQALIRKFPFCIPFDFIDSIKLLAGKPVPPKFTLPFKVKDPINRSKEYFDEITIDFEQFEQLALISRISFTLIFIVALMFITSKTIKW